MATNNATNNFGGAGGALVLIDTQVAAGVAALNFTSGITGAYNNYYIVYGSIIDASASGGEFLLAQLSTNGGSTYISTGYLGASTSGLVLNDNIAGATTVLFGAGTFFNVTSGSGYVANYVSENSVIPASGSNGAIVGGCYDTPNIVVNALRVVIDTGDTFSGTVSLYGITT